MIKREKNPCHNSRSSQVLFSNIFKLTLEILHPVQFLQKGTMTYIFSMVLCMQGTYQHFYMCSIISHESIFPFEQSSVFRNALFL
jgi:hypothetical protein